LENLYRLNKNEITRVGEMLTEAFQDDPVFNAIFEDATFEQRRAFFTTPVMYSRKYGQVMASSSQLEGVAAWVPGKYAQMTLPRLILSGAFFTGMQMGMDVSKRMATVFKPTDDDRKAFMHGRDYFYLVMIGVAPQSQGQGLGGKLLQAVIDESEKSGLPVYLETETEENVSIYEHFGFTVIEKVMLPLIDLPMWEMIREPGA
jgi:ribosomal protein S18 acetylase RimI-like enzyme